MAIIAPRQRRGRVQQPCASRGAGEHDRVLAVAFPDNQMQVLPYNRVVKDLNGMTPEAFLDALEQKRADAQGRSPIAERKGQVAMYLERRVAHAAI